jgi:enoyl-CoA hydratase/carnithine racemase
VADLLTYALDGSTAVVTMDDGKANALSNEMIDQLLAALTRAETEAKAMVLAGRPERFCAGFDLKVMMSGPANATALLTRGSELLLRLYAAKVPLVIACTGHALAGGALVVLTGDLRIAAAGAFKIGLNEVSIGQPVPVLAMELARDRIVKPELDRATLMATIYNPEEAQLAGYVDAVVAPGEVIATATAEAAKLGAFSQQAFRATKQRLRGATIKHIRATMAEDMATLLTPQP